MRCGPSWSRCCRIVRRVGADRGLITGRCSKRSCGGSGPGLRGGIFLRSSRPGRRCGTGSTRGLATAPSTGFCRWCKVARRPPARWTGRCRWMPRSRGRISTRRGRQIPKKGAGSNYKNSWHEPDDHALGRSRGGWTTKAHAAVDGNGRLLSVVLTAGQAGDNPQLMPVIDAIAVPTGARPRCRPQVLIADKAYSHASTRILLRARGIRAVIPQRSDQIAHRRSRGRPVAGPRLSTLTSTSCATSWNAPSTDSNNGARLPPATTNTPETIARESCWPPSSCSGYEQFSDTP